MKMYQVDAFTEKVFSGNPAAVCVTEHMLSDELMLKLAVENNLSETAFAVGSNGRYKLRWFTPGGEIDLCGHATLATSFVIANFIEPGIGHITFEAMKGTLEADVDGNSVVLDFPRIETHAVEVNDLMTRTLGTRPLESAIGYRDPIFLLEDEDAVRDFVPNFDAIASYPDGLGLFITAPGKDCDFVSRAFWPKIKVNEDPVCGSMHCSLGDYWGKKLGKSHMEARQLSARGGELDVEIVGDRVRLGGKAVLFAVFDIDDSVMHDICRV